MPNIASAFKEEVTRLARKELRATTDSLRKAVTSYRSEIAALKRRIEQLERRHKRTAKSVGAKGQDTHETAESVHRWRAAGFAKHRQRLGLSAADCGKLVGVSGLTIYKWEKGETRPRPSVLPAISELRAMGKREAQKRLDQLSG